MFVVRFLLLAAVEVLSLQYSCWDENQLHTVHIKLQLLPSEMKYKEQNQLILGLGRQNKLYLY